MNIMDIVKSKIRGSQYYYERNYSAAESIESLPIMDKNEAIREWDHIFNHDSKNVMYTQTSGSNGIPLKIAWNHTEYLQSIATIWRKRKQHGIVPSDFYLTCHAEFDVHNKRVESPVVIMDNCLSLSKLCMSEEIIAEYLYQIQLFTPKWIYAQPSFVYYLGMNMQKSAPELTKMFTYIELVGEMLAPDIKAQIAAIFPNATVVNMYGMQEFNSIMYEEAGIMMPLDDNAFIEILDDEGQRCSDGIEGNIVVTGLKNSAFPLVRYKTGDRGVRVINDGVVGYLITSGRSNDELIYNGRRYDGSLFFVVVNEYNNTHDTKISRFQVVYRDGMLNFNISCLDNAVDLNNIEHDLEHILSTTYLIQLPVCVSVIRERESVICGKNKVKYFINSEI